MLALMMKMMMWPWVFLSRGGAKGRCWSVRSNTLVQRRLALHSLYVALMWYTVHRDRADRHSGLCKFQSKTIGLYQRISNQNHMFGHALNCSFVQACINERRTVYQIIYISFHWCWQWSHGHCGNTCTSYPIDICLSNHLTFDLGHSVKKPISL